MNIDRFPSDFMFSLNTDEIESLISQIVISKKYSNRGIPMAFTESGVAMLSSVLKSKKAIEINIVIMRIFVSLRRKSLSENNLDLKISSIEDELSKHSDQLRILFDLLDKLSEKDPGLNPGSTQKEIGFKFP